MLGLIAQNHWIELVRKLCGRGVTTKESLGMCIIKNTSIIIPAVSYTKGEESEFVIKYRL